MSKHAYSVAVGATRCRKQKTASPDALTKTRCASKPWKQQGAVDQIASFVAGETDAEPAGLGGGATSEASNVEEASVRTSPRVSAPGATPTAVGNLDELRKLTSEKFARLGIALDGEGKVSTSSGPNGSKSLVQKKPGAAAVQRKPAGTTKRKPGAGLERPATVAKKKPSGKI